MLTEANGRLMGFALADIVPWGRSFEEYRAMFALSDDDLAGRIVDIGAGPSSFAAESAAAGRRVTALDPLYAVEPAAIERRIDETFDLVMEQTRSNVDDFVWDRYGSVDALGQARMAAMRRFLDDYPSGRRDKRYVANELPDLPFVDAAFDLALCSQLLFPYSEQLTTAFHVESIAEMLRIAAEVRVFPLVELGNARSRHLASVINSLGERGLAATIERVDYEFQLGGNEMLRVVRKGLP